MLNEYYVRVHLKENINKYIINIKLHMKECNDHFTICVIPEWGIIACQLSDYWITLQEDGFVWLMFVHEHLKVHLKYNCTDKKRMLKTNCYGNNASKREQQCSAFTMVTMFTSVLAMLFRHRHKHPSNCFPQSIPVRQEQIRF